MTESRWALEPELTKREALAGLVYLPFHVLGLPQLLGALSVMYPKLTVAWANGILYGVGMVFLALVFGKRLFAHYNIWCDRPGRVWLSLLRSFLLFLALSFALSLLLGLLGADTWENPANEVILSLDGADYRVTCAMAMFLAPLLEETLFRGVLFGALRGSRPVLAYVVSCGVFAAAHLWPYIGLGPMVWLCVLQYLPVSVALCYSYEKSGCLWTPILLHMINNAMAYALLG